MFLAEAFLAVLLTVAKFFFFVRKKSVMCLVFSVIGVIGRATVSTSGSGALPGHVLLGRKEHQAACLPSTNLMLLLLLAFRTP